MVYLLSLSVRGYTMKENEWRMIIMESKADKKVEVESELYNNLYDSKKEFFNTFKENIINIIDNPEKKFSRNIVNTDKNLGKIIALNASWGLGKTYFIDCLEDVIEKENKNRDKNKVINVKKINAWEAQKYGKPIFAFLLEGKGYKRIKASVSLGINLGPASAGVDLESYDDEIKKEIESVNKKYNKIVKNNEVILYLIDELDRCNPSYILEFLETLQYVVSMNCAVVSVNLKALDRLLESTHVEDEEKYYDKIFYDKSDLPFTEDDFAKILKDELNIENYEFEFKNLYISLNALTKVTPRLTYKMIDNKRDIFEKIFSRDDYIYNNIRFDYQEYGIHAIYYFAAHVLLDMERPGDEFDNLKDILDFSEYRIKLTREDKTELYKRLDTLFYGRRY